MTVARERGSSLFNGRRAIKYLASVSFHLAWSMWTINCPYFGLNIFGNTSKTALTLNNASNSRHLESKLLKCGQTYPVGRKDAKININEPWISRAQGSFTVGPYAEGDVVSLPHLVQSAVIRITARLSSTI
jgi:hypothetical protein